MIDSYEHNLKLYNESIRKDLDVILSSTIPTQKNLMKTLLWINSIIIGLLTTIITSNIKNKIILISLSMPYLFSFSAIIILLLSLKDGRVKAFATPTIESIENIKWDKWIKSNALSKMNKATKEAFDTNSKIITLRGKKIAQATNFTITSIISIFIISIIYANINLKKGDYSMSNDNKNSEFDDRPKMSTSTSKPEVMLATNNKTITENVTLGFMTNTSMDNIKESTDIKASAEDRKVNTKQPVKKED
jgi:hypothetical protein